MVSVHAKAALRPVFGRVSPCVPRLRMGEALPLQADSGQFWAAVSPSLERGHFPSGLFTEDEKKSRIKAGVAVGAFGRLHLPAVRAVTRVFGVSKVGSKTASRDHVWGHYPRTPTAATKKQGSHESPPLRETPFSDWTPPSRFASHETKIEALPRAGKCDA